MKEKKARVEDALHACRAAVEEGILPGGGVAVIRAAAKTLDAMSRKTPRTMTMSPRHRNHPPGDRSPHQADRPATPVWTARSSAQKVKESKETNFGYNALTHEYGDMLKMGVIVPTKVERTALQNAASISSSAVDHGCDHQRDQRRQTRTRRRRRWRWHGRHGWDVLSSSPLSLSRYARERAGVRVIRGLNFRL